MILFPPVRGGARNFQVIDLMLALNLFVWGRRESNDSPFISSRLEDWSYVLEEIAGFMTKDGNI